MTRENWIWMPHAAHFIGSRRCEFHLATYVNGYIISTVGDYRPNPSLEIYETVGIGRTFETMVFPAQARDSENELCCIYEANHDDGHLEMNGYNSATEARQGHYALCEKYDKMTPPAPPMFPLSNVCKEESTVNLYEAIQAFNKNVELIKTWMSAQHTQNSLFLDRIQKMEKRK